ncbi:hypothetical protein [Rhodopila sp.]|uniref:hypothetical protein n=1 Tax=Rhodopila sp. TaxID=2480087 RepID=UPI003D1448E4
MTVSGHTQPPNGPPNEPPNQLPAPTGPQDNPFLERLFTTMCRYIYVLPEETFVHQVQRWIDALHFMTSLKPRTEQEWLLASDVTMQHMFAQQSLALSRGKGVRIKQRMQHGKDFITHAKTLHAAQLRYELVRAKPAA